MIRLAHPSLILALVASGCVAASTGGSSPLDGTRWRFTAIDGAAPVSAETSLAFTRKQLSANVGCNGLGGEWRVEGGRLVAGPLIGTQMWCDGKMEQERAVSTLLSSSPEIVRSGGKLQLRSAGHSAELIRQ